MSVIDVVMISSPGLGIDGGDGQVDGGRARTSRRRRTGRPSISAKSVSRSLANRPLVLVSVPLRIASVTAAISSSPSVRPVGVLIRRQPHV